MNKYQLIEELKRENFAESVINAFRKIRREDFIPKELEKYAYENQPLPIGEEATISQPYTIAFMLSLLELDKLNDKNNKILEIGSGSGYVLALINEICRNSKIYGVEIVKKLADKSKKILKNKRNIRIIQGDGSRGLKESSPFDRILISASAEKIPQHLLSQLKYKGILVCPVQNSIFKIRKQGSEIIKKEFRGFVFVPLVEGKK